MKPKDSDMQTTPDTPEYHRGHKEGFAEVKTGTPAPSYDSMDNNRVDYLLGICDGRAAAEAEAATSQSKD